MSVRIPDYQRIRGQLDNFALKSTLNNQLTDGAARFARGSGLRLEFALYYGEEIADPSLITTARLRILSGSTPDTAIAMDQIIGVDQMNPGITEEQWRGGELDKCHLAFVFEAAQTAETVFGSLPDESQHWFQLTYGPNDTTWFCGLITSLDPGYDAPGNAPPSSPTNISREEVVQLIAAFTQNLVKYVGNPPGAKVEFTSPNATKKGKIGIADTGDWDTPNQVT